ncbi:hypothetical protein QTO34_018587 [Cnephaeus nilssonii]|uniref:LRRNT domain-containing protein n=1 Tax=Cnephaeus nilssonii TaxID=3371016 RepID=A0AA40HZ32_CNENI|nr:hypothetical protein QTO34_018587 [Eptesicus nilssonii]
MARSRALLLLLLLPPQLQLGLVLAVRAPVFGRNGAHSLSPEENEFVEEEPVLVLRPEEPGPGPATINCPRDCACSQEGVVDCGGIDLREFPGDLPEHTNHLSLQNNQLEKIFPEELSRLHRLETLNLQNNRLTSRGLPEEAFEHLTSLNYLYLANNKLTLAPRFLPNTLISVDFAANYLTKIYGLTFGQKPNLRSVYLHNNKLADAGLPDNMFNGSSNVEILILSSNFLRHVPKHLPPALYKLHLKNNKLEKIPPGAFSELSNLRELYLQNNYLTDEGLDNETFWKLSSLEYLDLSSNNLSRVPGRAAAQPGAAAPGEERHPQRGRRRADPHPQPRVPAAAQQPAARARHPPAGLPGPQAAAHRAPVQQRAGARAQRPAPPRAHPHDPAQPDHGHRPRRLRHHLLPGGAEPQLQPHHQPAGAPRRLPQAAPAALTGHVWQPAAHAAAGAAPQRACAQGQAQ